MPALIGLVASVLLTGRLIEIIQADPVSSIWAWLLLIILVGLTALLASRIARRLREATRNSERVWEPEVQKPGET